MSTVARHRHRRDGRNRGRTNMNARRFYIVFAVMAACFASAAIAQPKALDKVVAVVGGEIITQSELDLQLMRYATRTKVDIYDPAVRRKALDEMIGRKLILAQAILDSVNVSDEQVTQQLNEQIKMFEQSYGSIEKLEKAAGMTLSQLKRDFREDIRKNLLVETLQREKFGNISVSNREIEEFFSSFKDSLPQVSEQAQLRQITVFPRVTDAFRITAKEKAAALLDSIKRGADFADLAKRYSDDAGSARNGGDLGIARRGVFVKEFEEAAFSLAPGEVSQVIETQFGFHILKVLERKGESVRVQHILIRVQKTGESDSTATTVLADLRRRIVAGEDFAALAREYSQDQATKSLGGDLGLVEVAQLSDDLRLLQQSMNPGDISQPAKLSFEKDYAFAIVQLVKRLPPHAPTLQQDYQRIAGFARLFKQNKLYLDWIEDIKKNVYWKVLI
jgi:peptidyl-prolyl cis-trans isomerase SurA